MRVKFRYLKILIVILLIVLPLICLGYVRTDNNQAVLPVPLKISFEGEYSFDGEKWFEYCEEDDISSFDGDVTFRGHFTENINEGAMLNFYSNHIGISVYVNDKLIYMDQGKFVALMQLRNTYLHKWYPSQHLGGLLQYLSL